MDAYVFDVETGPLAAIELATMMPAFDPAEVKTGNLKDPAKIAEKLAEAEANHRRDFIERAALDPITARVVAVGMLDIEKEKFFIIGHEDEAQTLTEFWKLVRGEMGRINPLIGFNIFNFDLPFLIRRSWKHRVTVPFGLRRGRYWSEQICDLRECWQLGDRQAKGSLDAIAKHLGVGAKNGDGKAFAELWVTDRAKAEAYLRNDVELTAKVAEALEIQS